MNFNWRKTKLSDCKIFSTWSDAENFIVKHASNDEVSLEKTNNIKRFIMCGENNFGEYVKNIINGKSEKIIPKLNRANCLTVELFDGTIVGFVMFRKSYEKGTKKLEGVNLNNVVVNPNLQGRGYGTAMIFDIVKNRVRVLGCKPDIITGEVEKINQYSSKILKNNNFRFVAHNKFEMEIYALKFAEHPIRPVNKLLNKINSLSEVKNK